ncbi:MAG: hypothetical protein HOQ35_18090 [Acidobacteriaceae bacterium]|nr:hypothetical protein [Acidobacteriaceae bacterium]
MDNNQFGFDSSTPFQDPNLGFTPDPTPPHIPDQPQGFPQDPTTGFGSDFSMHPPDVMPSYVTDSTLGFSSDLSATFGLDPSLIPPDVPVPAPDPSIGPDFTQSDMTIGTDTSWLPTDSSTTSWDATTFGPDPPTLGPDLSPLPTDSSVPVLDPPNINADLAMSDLTLGPDTSTLGPDLANADSNSTTIDLDASSVAPDSSLSGPLDSPDGNEALRGQDINVDGTTATVAAAETNGNADSAQDVGKQDHPNDGNDSHRDTSSAGDDSEKPRDRAPGDADVAIVEDARSIKWTPPSGEGVEQGPGTVVSPVLGGDFSFSQSYWAGPDGSKTFTMVGTTPDGTPMLLQQYEWEGYAQDHVIVLVDGSKDSGVPGGTGTEGPGLKDSPLVQMGGGIVVGGGLTAVPIAGPSIGPLAQATGIVDKPSTEFKKGYGIGELATGVVQTVSGIGAIIGGGTSAVAGVGGAPETGGASLALTALGATSVVVGAAGVTQGITNIAVGAGILHNEITKNTYLSQGGTRPHPSTSEDFSGNPEILGQRSFRGGFPSPNGRQGSTRPDGYLPEVGVVIEVKNYDLSKGSSKLINNVVEQALRRQAELPEGLKQALVIDVRGQNVTEAQAQNIIDTINQRTGNLFDNRWWFFTH